MQKWGKTVRGSVRYRCAKCQKSKSDNRSVLHQNTQRHHRWETSFKSWLVGNQSQAAVAAHLGITPRALRKRFASFWEGDTRDVVIQHGVTGVILDGTTIVGRHLWALIAQCVAGNVIGWSFESGENYRAWHALLTRLSLGEVKPLFVVCDGHKGLLKAVREVWGADVVIQRCIVHVVRMVRLRLTKRPKTAAGRSLLRLMPLLEVAQTPTAVLLWQCGYEAWLKHYDEALKQRTNNPEGKRKWWYTHKNLRAVRSLLNNASPDMFHFLDNSNIPRTSNRIEGGINSRLKELLYRHRGLVPKKQIKLVDRYLHYRSTLKPPKNQHGKFL
jgi:hypothetical protein